MRWSRLSALTVLAYLCSGGFSLLFAQKQWIHPGSYLDWPETFREPGPVSLPTAPGTAIQVRHLDLPEPLPESLHHQPVPVPQAVCVGPELTTYGWQFLPQGLLYRSYLAGEKEPRFAAQWLWERDRGLVWETALGGRWGLVRHGTYGIDGEGFQFDVEGAALARVDPEEESDLEAVDFRAGLVGTWRKGRWRYKFGYYHISSHVGDEFLIKNPTHVRLNYVRDSLLVGVMYDITDDLQIYGEFAPALNANGGAEMGEFQFGAQYSPLIPTGIRGAPFAAINGHLRQEYDYGGSVNVVAGWQWRGARSNHLLRFGVQHYNGPSMQWSFVNRYECLTGIGIWFDY